MASKKKVNEDQPFEIQECRRSVRQVQLLSLEEHEGSQQVEDEEVQDTHIDMTGNDGEMVDDTVQPSELIERAITNAGIFNDIYLDEDIVELPDIRKSKVGNPSLLQHLSD